MRFVLFRGRGLISRAIRWQTRSTYSHAALLVGDDEIIEAWQGAGVRRKKVTDWTDADVFEVETTEEEDDLILQHAAWCVGRRYDYLSVLRFVSRRRPPDSDRMFCSELVFSAFQAAFINLLERVDAGRVSPGMLAWSPLATLIK